MKTALKNNSWITTIVFALIEFPIIIFLSYFSLGSKDDIMEIYHSDPSRIIFIRGCISFVITSSVMSLIMLLYVIIKRILLNVRVTRKKIFISLGLNFVITNQRDGSFGLCFFLSFTNYKPKEPYLWFVAKLSGKRVSTVQRVKRLIIVQSSQ